MTKTTAPEMTREQLEAQAAELNRQLDQIRAEDQRAAEAAAQRRAAAEARSDRELLASVSVPDLVADAEKAGHALDQALATEPLVIALANFWTALRRQSVIRQELSSARERLGQSAIPAAPLRTEVTGADLIDLLVKSAGRIATDRVADEVAGIYARRDAAGEAAAKQEG